MKFAPKDPIYSNPALVQIMVPKRRHALIWTKADVINWCIYAVLGGDELKVWSTINHYCCPRGWDPDSKVPETNMGPIWGRQDPGGPHVGPMNFAMWECMLIRWWIQIVTCIVLVILALYAIMSYWPITYLQQTSLVKNIISYIWYTNQTHELISSMSNCRKKMKKYTAGNKMRHVCYKFEVGIVMTRQAIICFMSGNHLWFI